MISAALNFVLAIAISQPGPQSTVLQAPSAIAVATAIPARSGEKDFDFEFGTWTTKVRVLRNPLSGEAPKWAEY